MINNNVPQNPNVNSGSVMDGSIYLKKSELPKNVGAFDNDKGYISSSALEVWMMKHSYIPRPEIERLIKKANIEIIDIVNKSSDGEAIKRLDSYIEGINREIVEIKDRLNKIGISDITEINGKIDTISNDINEIRKESKNYLTEHQSLEGYVTKQWVNDQKYLTKHQSLSNYISKPEMQDIINGLALKNDIPNIPEKISYFKNDVGYVIKDNLSSYATQEWVEKKKYLTEHQSLKGYVKNTDIPNLTQDFIKKDNMSELMNEYAKKTDIPEIPTKISEFENDKGYLTEHQSLKDYAKNSSLSSYVRKTDLNTTLTGYAKKTDVYAKSSMDNILTDYLKKDDAKNQYPSKVEVSKTYITKTDANNSFLRIEDYRGIKDAATINDEYKEKSLGNLTDDIKGLMNGFYIVNGDDIVIVKDHKIINMFKDGVSQPSLVWREE